MVAPTREIFDHLSVLSDLTRVRLLTVLEDHELTVGDLCRVLDLPQSTTSRHLRILLDHGWVTRRREGTRRFYSLVPASADDGGQGLWDLVGAGAADLPSIHADRRRLAEVLASRRTASEAYFSRTGEAWAQVRSEVFGDRFDLLGLLGLLDPAWTLGDLGCGTGNVSMMVAPFVARVIAVDGSDAMLGAASDNLSGLGNVELRKGVLEELPIADGVLDVATLFLVLHHVADPVRVIREAARVMKAGARLMIVDMEQHEDEALAGRMGHVWLGFDRSNIEAVLHRVGFDRVVTRSLPPESSASGPGLFVAAGRRACPEPVSVSG